MAKKLMETQDQRPYSGVRIIDLTRELGSYCTRLFADLGAEVIRVEPPQGRSDRLRPPFVADVGSIPFAFLNLNKKAVRVDTSTESGRGVFADLVGAAHVVVHEPGATDVSVADVVAIPGARVVTSVSYFGLTGPYAGFAGCDLIAQALGGIAWLSGEPGKPPLKLAGEQSVFVTSLYAAAATALALWDLEKTGTGHLLDVSSQEAIAHSLQNAPQVYDLEGQVMSRGGEGVRDATEAAFACRDGYVFLAAPLSLSVSWNALLKWMQDEGFEGVDRLLQDDWKDRPTRATAAMKAEFRPLFECFVASKTKAELSAEALKRKLVMAPVSRIADLQADPQLLFRQFFHTVPMPGLGKDVAFPGPPYRLSEPLWRIERAGG
jgi:benzylsuccinate CoA-transferase BbsE subunit